MACLGLGSPESAQDCRDGPGVRFVVGGRLTCGRIACGRWERALWRGCIATGLRCGLRADPAPPSLSGCQPAGPAMPPTATVDVQVPGGVGVSGRAGGRVAGHGG